MIVYFNGRFMPKEDVRISPDERGFLLADGAYEVIRAYDGALFRAREHVQRMQRSLRELRMVMPRGRALDEVGEELIRRNNLDGADATLYVQVTRGEALRKHSFPEEGTPPTIYASVAPFEPSLSKQEKGVSIILVPDIRWARCDIKSVALLPNVLASQQAKECGAEEAVFVRDGVVTEGSHTNFCAVFGTKVVTHPCTYHILAGITRQIVLELCTDLGIPNEESPIPEERMHDADEMMIVGTTTEIMPIVQVNGWQVGDAKPGPITRKLQQAFARITRR